MDETDTYCIGCLRTREEIGQWTCYSEEEQLCLLEELEKRKLPEIDMNTQTQHIGILSDEKRREHNMRNKYNLCDRCDGTGNELYSMYRECSECKGTGRKK